MEQLPDHLEKANKTGEEKSSSLMFIAESVGAYFGKLPVALQKNVTKAIGHLLGVPIAYLDGIASELKATSAARVKITEATGDKLAKSIKVDSELADITLATHANKILRHQKNSIKILNYAAEELESTQHQNRIEPALSSEQEQGQEQVELKEISEDWLNVFESEAVNMSSEQMQRLFGKLLAGEIRKPSTFSVRTVKLMGQLDNDVATIFRQFCSFVSSIKHSSGVVDGRALSLGNKTDSCLFAYGIGYTHLVTLEEYGLITRSTPEVFPYVLCVFRTTKDDIPRRPLTYCGVDYVLMPEPPKTGADFKKLVIEGIPLSRVGREIFSIVEPEENHEYSEALSFYLKTKSLTLYPLP